jgi:hypothetical protein
MIWRVSCIGFATADDGRKHPIGSSFLVARPDVSCKKIAGLIAGDFAMRLLS